MFLSLTPSGEVPWEFQQATNKHRKANTALLEQNITPALKISKRATRRTQKCQRRNALLKKRRAGAHSYTLPK